MRARWQKWGPSWSLGGAAEPHTFWRSGRGVLWYLCRAGARLLGQVALGLGHGEDSAASTELTQHPCGVLGAQVRLTMT